MSEQLTLGIGIHEPLDFGAFHPGGNRQAVQHTQAIAGGEGESFLYLWGPKASGKSHLLQAACRLAAEHEQTLAYVPLTDATRFGPEILDDLGKLQLVCIDDIDRVAGQTDWEQALFRLFNQLRDAGSRLLVSADRSPSQLTVALPDLHSRLGWGVCFQLHPLDDQARIEALIMHAKRRGLELPPETAGYILRHSTRDMHSLLELLDELDRASLAAQRKLTIPFAKEIVG